MLIDFIEDLWLRVLGHLFIVIAFLPVQPLLLLLADFLLLLNFFIFEHFYDFHENGKRLGGD